MNVVVKSGMPDYKEMRHVCDTAVSAIARAKGE